MVKRYAAAVLLLGIAGCAMHQLHAPPPSTPYPTIVACASAELDCVADCSRLPDWWPWRQSSCISDCDLASDGCVGYIASSQ
jgi:hypothetical protein